MENFDKFVYDLATILNGDYCKTAEVLELLVAHETIPKASEHSDWEAYDESYVEEAIEDARYDLNFNKPDNTNANSWDEDLPF